MYMEIFHVYGYFVYMYLEIFHVYGDFVHVYGGFVSMYMVVSMYMEVFHVYESFSMYMEVFHVYGSFPCMWIVCPCIWRFVTMQNRWNNRISDGCVYAQIRKGLGMHLVTYSDMVPFLLIVPIKGQFV